MIKQFIGKFFGTTTVQEAVVDKKPDIEIPVVVDEQKPDIEIPVVVDEQKPDIEIPIVEKKTRKKRTTTAPKTRKKRTTTTESTKSSESQSPSPKTERELAKEYATKHKEPWVDVVSFSINPANIRNGFYELDWNEYFIIQLRIEGYGLNGDPEDEIVSRWFRDICISAAESFGIEDMDGRSSGSLDITTILANNLRRN